jgi:hypothetical protein
MAKSFAAGGHFLFRGQPSPLFSLYPALISPAWRASSMHTTYEIAKSINVVMMTAAAVPFWFWARRLAGGWYAVLGTALFLALPIYGYTGVLMTESAALPLFVLSFFLIGLVLERPTPLRQVLALVAIGLACSVRFQALVLILVLLGGILVKLGIDASAGAVERSRRAAWLELRRYWLAVGLIFVGAIAYLLLKVAEGQPLSSGLRAYAGLAKSHYSIRDVLRWTVYHAGELVLAVGVIPACAFVVLLALFRRSWQATAAERAYLAVTIVALPLILVQVAAFASRYSLRVEERNMFYLEPLLLLALVIWLARALPRPPALVSVGVAVAVGLLITVPFESLFNVSAETDTFGIVPFIRLGEALNGGASEVRTLIGIGAICAAILFAAVPRTAALWAVPAALAGFLVLSSGSVFAKETYIASATRHAGALGNDPSWIDHAVGRNARVEFLYTTDIDRDQHILWQSEFWNRSLRRVFGVTSNDPSIPDVTAPVDPASGRIRPNLPDGSPDARPRYVVAASGVAVAGKRLAQNGFLSLYRVREPLGLSSLVSGLQPDAWTGLDATYTSFRGSGSRRLNVLVWRPAISGPPPAHVTVAVGPLGSGSAWETRRWTLQNGKRHLFALHLKPGPYRVRLSVDPTFVPSQYGQVDTRTLGVQASFNSP